MNKLLKDAIADAKAVRETALANAKLALEEAFAPKLQSMLSSKIREEMEEDDEFVALLLNELKGKLKQPSIDQLLDKISSQGIMSLTPYEKAILDNYSK